MGHTRRTLVGATAGVGVFHNVSTIHLVVQGVEAKVGFILRFGMQRRLQLLDILWSC